jgi:hypothetical protein
MDFNRHQDFIFLFTETFEKPAIHRSEAYRGGKQRKNLIDSSGVSLRGLSSE